MAVQIPIVQRNAPIAEPSVGRVDIQPTDISSAQNVVRGATNSLVNASLTAFEEHKTRAAETIAKDAAYKYNKLLRQQYEGGEGKLGLKHMDGDPGPGYTQFRQYTDDQYNAISSEYGEASDKVKIAIKGQLDQVKNKFSDIAISSEAAQLDRWQTSVTQNSVAMAKEDILDQSGTFTTKDLQGNPIADPYMDFDNTLAKINNTWMEHGKDRGTVKEVLDKEGKPVLNARGEKSYAPSASVAMRIAKDKSDAIENVINNLRTSGRVDEAVEVAAHYKDIIDAAARPKINKELEEATLEKNAYAELAKVQQLPILEAKKQLDKISDQKLQEKALEKFGTYKARIDRLDDLQQGEMYSSVFNDLVKKQTTGQPFVTVDEMMSDPSYKARIEKMTKPENVKALMAMIKPKEDTDHSANLEYMYDAMSGGLNNISKEELAKKLSPISGKDQKWALDLYKFVITDTESEKRSRYNVAIGKLKETMTREGLIQPETKGRGLSDKDAKRLAEASRELFQNVGALPSDITQLQNFIDNYVIDFNKRLTKSNLEKALEGIAPTVKQISDVFGLNRPVVTGPYKAPPALQRDMIPTPSVTTTPQPTVVPGVTVAPQPTPSASAKSMENISGKERIRLFFKKYPERLKAKQLPTDEELRVFMSGGGK